MYADNILDVFSQRYRDAHDTFSAAVETSSIVEKHNKHLHPEKGPQGEKLVCDVVWTGNLDAKHVLVLISGLHGVEGGVGSALQSDFVSRHRRLPSDVCVVLVHAVNPWGFAWGSRNDHTGIDLNRNFVDFTKPLHQSESNLIWQSLIEGKRSISEVGSDRVLFDCLSEGQYHDATALYFGGFEPSWSRNCIEQIAGQLKLAERDRVLVVDIHSGLGPYGYGELISDHPIGSPATKQLKALFGSTITEPSVGTSSSGVKFGLHDYFWHQQGDHIEFVTLEFGTYSSEAMLNALFADQQLQQNGIDWQDDATLNIKHALQDYFCPDDKQWKELVLFRGRQVIEMAINGLTRHD
jgi:hypothetical protein